jgi:hypothetical protein
MLRRLGLFLLCLLVASFSLALAPSARADGARISIAVLSVESDDAEDQAEALTQAMRSKLRSGPSFQVVEVTQSLGMLMGAQKCGKALDAACQAKIADQLKVERLIWGRMAKSPNKEVTADLHLFHKGRGDTGVRESYSDNLKDGNDDALRKVAQRILDRLLAKDPGFVLIKGNASEVVVDGTKRAPLDKGSARLDLAPGSHTLELSGKGLKAQKREVTVAPGQEVAISVTLASDAVATPGVVVPPTEPDPGGGGTSTRKIIGYSLMGVGAAGVITGGVFGAMYLDKSGKQADLNASFPSNVGDACEFADSNVQGGGTSKANAKEACNNSKSGEKAGTIGWIVGGAGAALLGAGAYFAFTGGDSQDKEKPKRGTIRVTPAVGRESGGVVVFGQF